MVRHIIITGLVAATVATAAVTTAAASAVQSDATATRVLVVRPTTLIQMSGSDLYCTVVKPSGGPTVACFHDPGGPSSSKRKGYAIAASDHAVAVEPPKSNTPILLRREPSLASTPIAGGHASSTLVQLVPNELIEIGGTHMVLAIKQFADIGPSVIVVKVDANGNLINGTYGAEIGNKAVAIAKVVKGAFRPVYQHAAY